MILDENSVFSEAPSNRGSVFLELSTLQEHPKFYWNFIEADAFDYKNDEILEFVSPTFFFSRVNPNNIMHFLHDDFLGLYHTIRYFSKHVNDDNLDFEQFDDNRYIQFLDDNGISYHDFLYQFLTKYPLMYKVDLGKNSSFIRYHEAIVGISRLTTWYQYGFKEPQGPIKNKNVQGYHVRQASNFILHKFNIESPKQDTIAILSRRKNRLILNENDLLNQLIFRFPDYKVKFVRNEDSNLKEQIQIVRRSKVLIGMHGSILALSMFLQPGSSLIELFPFAVPAENYTPYKTLCALSGINIRYNSWVNKNESMNVEHPEYPVHLGGFGANLETNVREHILGTKTVPQHLCCSDPFWLFRIYQDTLVNLEEVTDLTQKLLEEKAPQNTNSLEILNVGRILNPECSESQLHRVDGNTFIYAEISWFAPWNTAVDSYEVFELLTNRNYASSTSSLKIFEPMVYFGTQLTFWVTPRLKNGATGFRQGPFKCVTNLKFVRS